MSLTLKQRQKTRHRLNMHGLLPERLHDMDDQDILRIPLHQGKRVLPLSDLFDLDRQDDDDMTLTVEPLDDRLDRLGAGMTEGRFIVRGDTGHFAGQGMSGGVLTVEGDTADHTGSGITGGKLEVLGNSGDFVGAPSAGERLGQQGGLIHIHGNVGKRAGERQRRGMLLIGGDTGELLGHRMVAGTIYVDGMPGEMAGYGMKRGSLVLRQHPRTLCSTIVSNGAQRLSIVKMMLEEVQRISNDALGAMPGNLNVERYLGDIAADGRGEILILD